MDECMKNDCSSNFKDAQPCYLSPKEQNGCNEKKTSYTKCMRPRRTLMSKSKEARLLDRVTSCSQEVNALTFEK
ncbi:hypothetical protein M513_13450 [Trichuris suis]|uniref:Uncharacterized protein n=1 Tax=Trichuris suis TaxID=68888 RepID=A0A085LL21_9BILA|nr:hypothetical protein M513_13450 [Trichuris suis]